MATTTGTTASKAADSGSPSSAEAHRWVPGREAADRRRSEQPEAADSPGASRRRRRLGTATRLAAFHAGVLALVLGAVTVALVHQFSTGFEQVAQRNMVAELRQFASSVPPATGKCSLVTSAVRYFKVHEPPAGTVLAIGVPLCRDVATGSNAATVLADREVLAALGSSSGRTNAWSKKIAGVDMELLSAPVVSNGRRVGTFVAATDLTPFLGDRSRMLRLTVAEGAVALLAGVASAYWLLRRLLRTVGRITGTAEEIERGDIERRLGDQGTDDEVGQLATTFDRMLDRVEGAMTSQRRLLSDVSHQLRTPLTVARGHLEVLQRTGVDDTQAVNDTVALVVDELDHMRALTERLLLLGRAMEPDFLAPAPIDLRAFLADLYAAGRVLADRNWVLRPVPDVIVAADEAKLRGAVLNLLDNAVNATDPGVSVELSGVLESRSGDLLLSVEDAGPGIAFSTRAAVLARFSRAGAAEYEGSGLGLAIAKAVAEAHGGSLDIGDSHLGGCRVTLRLPADLVSRPV